MLVLSTNIIISLIMAMNVSMMEITTLFLEINKLQHIAGRSGIMIRSIGYSFLRVVFMLRQGETKQSKRTSLD